MTLAEYLKESTLSQAEFGRRIGVSPAGCRPVRPGRPHPEARHHGQDRRSDRRCRDRTGLLRSGLIVNARLIAPSTSPLRNATTMRELKGTGPVRRAGSMRRLVERGICSPLYPATIYQFGCDFTRGDCAPPRKNNPFRPARAALRVRRSRVQLAAESGVLPVVAGLGMCPATCRGQQAARWDGRWPRHLFAGKGE